MNAEVIAIGDELSSGQRLDTNTQWLSQRLGELGATLVRHTTVGDNLQHNIDALREAASRAQIVVVTGGLGPTLDDLTRQAIADAWDVPLQLDEASLEHIQQLFEARGRDMPERNRSQAMFPLGSRVITNPFGSAPGVDFDVPGGTSRIFALPGVPAEMKQMWTETVAPCIDRMIGGQLAPMRFHAVRAFGIGESDVEVRLPDLISRDRQPTVGITVSRATITLRIAARAESEEAFATFIAPTLQEIDTALGDIVFGSGDDELETVAARLLRKQSARVVVVEIGGASPASDWLAAEVGVGDSFFAGGIALPDRASGFRWLGLQNETATTASQGDSVDATNQDAELASIASSFLKKIETDYVLVIDGYPRPEDMSNPNRMFDVHFALAFTDDTGGVKIHHQEKSLGGHPDVIIARIAKMGLDLLRRKILNLVH